MSQHTVRTTVESSGFGLWPTVEELLDLVSLPDLPPTAEVVVRSESQRDGSSWTASVSWDGIVTGGAS